MKISIVQRTRAIPTYHKSSSIQLIIESMPKIVDQTEERASSPDYSTWNIEQELEKEEVGPPIDYSPVEKDPHEAFDGASLVWGYIFMIVVVLLAILAVYVSRTA